LVSSNIPNLLNRDYAVSKNIIIIIKWNMINYVSGFAETLKARVRMTNTRFK